MKILKCTECSQDAPIAYCPHIIKRGKHRGEEEASWDGKILPGEHICLVCGYKRGLNFMNK